MRQQPAWDDVAVGVGVLLLAAIVGWQTTVIPDNAIYAKVGPKVIPWLSTALLAAMGIALTVMGLRGGWEHEDAGETDYRSLGLLVLGLILNIVLIDRAGFIIASTVLFTLTARAFGSRQILRDASIGFVLAVVAYLGFDRGLGYKIGSGLIEGLF
jgi:putative tricarboxylic transport membrane protein